ncbi:MAG: hypothetical protein GY822_11735 [Deltaproteobacteria bacterium]|nr:hypothetical protein [Deltaproteobacteria bacterium]
MAPISGYADFLNNLKGAGREDDISVAVIAGATLADNGDVVSNGCSVGDAGQPGWGMPAQSWKHLFMRIWR